MRTQEQDAVGVRTVSGLVLATGVISTGTGYTVSKSGTGTYGVRFQPGFRAYVSLVASTISGGFVVVTWSTPTADSVLINTYNPSATPTDLGFLFVARGLSR